VWPDAIGNLHTVLILGKPKLVVRLEIHLELGCGSELPRQTESRVRCDRSLLRTTSRIKKVTPGCRAPGNVSLLKLSSPACKNGFEDNSMNWVPVESSVFDAAAYFPGEPLLYLMFRSGDIYRYFDFPPEQYESSWRPTPKAGILLITSVTDTTMNRPTGLPCPQLEIPCYPCKCFGVDRTLVPHGILGNMSFCQPVSFLPLVRI
jgi:hypothetical protein